MLHPAHALLVGSTKTSVARTDRWHPEVGTLGASEVSMSVDRWIRLVAGLFVLASLALGHYVSPWFLLFTTFVGANLFQSALTNWCPLTYVLRGLGVRG
jgi:hypothetical protein